MFKPWKKSARRVFWDGRRKAAQRKSTGQFWIRQHFLWCMALSMLTVFAVSIVLNWAGGWGPPFAFRQGQLFPRGVRAKVSFSIVDEPATQQQREQIAIFRHDPYPLDTLEYHLKELCQAAYAGTPEEINPETLRFWALSGQEITSLGKVLRSPPIEFVPGLLRLPSSVLGGMIPFMIHPFAVWKSQFPIENEDNLRGRLEEAFRNLAVDGILNDEDVPLSVGSSRHLTVRTLGKVDRTVLMDQVLKSRLIGDGNSRGPLFLQFAKAFRNRQIAERLYALIVGLDDYPSRLPATLTYDAEATQDARDAVTLTKEFKRGAPLIEESDEPLDERDIALLMEEHLAYIATLTRGDQFKHWLSLFLITGMVAAFVGFYVWRFHPVLGSQLNRLAGLSSLLTAGITLAILVGQPPLYATSVPLTLTAMIVTVAFNQSLGLAVSAAIALLCAVAMGADQGLFLILVSGPAAATILLRNVRTRKRLVQVGFLAGLASALMTFAVGLLNEQSLSSLSWEAVRIFLMGLLSGFILTGGLPYFEKAFGVVTDISLLELNDVSHPLLRDLIRYAPGTYTHSVTVAALSESAAEAIGANPLLTHVGACFHDVGKMLKPHYFVENQTGENRHQNLAPAMSTLVIIGHVKDGVELARQHKLPQPIVDFITQHHGTTLIEYFYHQATKSHECESNNGELEASFRYPGPKPRSRETGIVMLADAAEGACRALDDPGAATITKLVHDLVMKRLLDGQFDECKLTLRDLHLVEESLCKSLIAHYHARIKYPEAKTAG